MITIDSDIPVPSPAPRPGGKISTYPFAFMKVGDSFALPPEETDRLAAAASKWKMRHPGWDYMKRTRGTEVRLWRLA